MSRARLPEPAELDTDDQVAETEWLRRNGAPAWSWADRLGTNTTALQRLLYRAGRHDLARELNPREDTQP